MFIFLQNVFVTTWEYSWFYDTSELYTPHRAVQCTHPLIKACQCTTSLSHVSLQFLRQYDVPQVAEQERLPGVALQQTDKLSTPFLHLT